jgi:hypothetical protein
MGLSEVCFYKIFDPVRVDPIPEILSQQIIDQRSTLMGRQIEILHKMNNLKVDLKKGLYINNISFDSLNQIILF